METVLGLNFGSSVVSIAKKGEGLVLKEANLISAKKNGASLAIDRIGDTAKSVLGKTDSSTVVFSPVSFGEISSVEYATAMLKNFLSKLGIKHSMFSPIKFISTIPMGLSEVEKQKYIDICENVKAKDVVLIPRIYCCAVAENINIGANNANMIVDIGGGTIDCAVINLNTIISGSTLYIGGRSMDTSIVSYIKFKYGATIGLKTATTLKENIGSLYSNDLAKMEVTATDDKTNRPVQLVVSAKDIYDATYVYLDEIVKIIQTTLNTLPPEIANDVARNGVYVCGGYSKVPGLEKYLRQRLNLPIKISDESNNAAANGLVKLVNTPELVDSIVKNL